ncbi:MAG: hypothetical protein M1828_005776 [Chrysothrix sp. TS-e1954]|nr:MAG: hypothetical protein M1828_005776 [Chrysothrix sp. TS-e1954]
MTDEPPPYVPATDDKWSLSMLARDEGTVYYAHPPRELVVHIQRAEGYAAAPSAYVEHHKAPKKTSFGISTLLTAARGKRYAKRDDARCLRCTEQFAAPKSKLPRRASLKSTKGPNLNLQHATGYVYPSNNWSSQHEHPVQPNVQTSTGYAALSDDWILPLTSRPWSNVQRACGYVSVPARWARNQRPARGERAVKSNGVDVHARSTMSSAMCGPGQIVQPSTENPLNVKEPAQITDSILPNIDTQITKQPTVTSTKSKEGGLTRRRSMEALHSSFKNFEGVFQEGQTSESPGLPQEIRLRRPSGQPRKNLPPLGSTLKANVKAESSGAPRRRSSLPHADISVKSEIAYEAVTHTAVHIFQPALADPPAELPSTIDEGSKTHSATLQVVRTRNSVYEVIWEDKLSTKHVETNASSKRSSADAEALSSVAAWSQESSANSAEPELPQKLVLVNTKLAAWSWGIDQESAYHFRALNNGPPPAAPTTTPAHADRSKATSTCSLPIPLIDALDLPSAIPEVNIEDTATSSSSSEPTPDDTLRRKRRSSEVSGFAPASLDPGSATTASQKPNLTANQRKDLLGNRKLSNITSEDDHFQSHRDSLMLAHERLHHDASDEDIVDMGKLADKAKPAKHDDRVAQLRKTTWSKKPHHEKIGHGGHGEAED